MPAEGVDARHDLIHLVEADRAVGELEKALSDDTALRQPLDFRIGYLRRHDPNAFRIGRERADRIERHAVVGPIGIRLHNDDTLQAELALQLAIHRDGEVSGQRRPSRRGRHVLIVEVHVRVAGTGRRFQFGDGHESS